MLKTSNYETQILQLFKEGKSPLEISKILNFKYWQPVYNLLKKKGIDYQSQEYEIYRKYTLDESFFEKINTEEKAYILGFICADGHVDYKWNRVKIMISVKDIDVLVKIKDTLKSNTIIKHSEQKNPYSKGKSICEMCSVEFNSVKMCTDLKNIGIKENKTYSLDSSVFNNVENDFKVAFLRGYFDGDGNVMYGKKYSSGTKYNINICGNEEFLLNTYQKMFPSQNKMYKDLYSKQCFVWKLSSKENVQKFLSFLYKDAKIYLNRKYEVYNAHVKPIELSGNLNVKSMVISSQVKSGSTTIEKEEIISL